jgi:hypothetical protein
MLVIYANTSVVFATEGTAKGGATDEPGQQGLGLKSESRSSECHYGGT